MNALSLTARDMANAILGKPRTEQAVRVVVSRFNGSPLGGRYTVLVDGEYYEVGEHVLQELRNGVTPYELELEPADPEREDYGE